MLLISCHILYAFHLHIVVLYSIHIISFLGFMSAYILEADTGNNCMYP